MSVLIKNFVLIFWGGSINAGAQMFGKFAEQNT